jgi:hypothetical protein
LKSALEFLSNKQNPVHGFTFIGLLTVFCPASYCLTALLSFQVYCKGMKKKGPIEYISFKVGWESNFAEVYGKR